MGYEFHFIDEGMVELLLDMVDSFKTSEETPRSLLERTKELLPVDRNGHAVLCERVEGFYEISEGLFQAVFDLGQARHGEEWDRKQVVKFAKLRPFSYYHWITGSREPANNVMTRKDYLNDPTTALAKLEEDILSLAKLYRELQQV